MHEHDKSQQMLALVNQWKESGLSRKAFADQKDINYHTFLYWLKKHQQEPEDNFIELPSFYTGQICISYPNGIEMRIPVGVSADYVRELIKQ